jgi:hypothetical protein
VTDDVSLRKHRQLRVDHPLDGRLVEEARPYLLHHAAVQQASGEVLGAGLGTALDEQHLMPCACDLVGRHAPGDAGSDDDDVEVDLRVLRRRVRGRHQTAWAVRPACCLIAWLAWFAASHPPVSANPQDVPGIASVYASPNMPPASTPTA